MLSILKKIDNMLEWVENWIMTLTGVAVCTLIFVSAMMRYILKVDFYGSEEIILFTAFWLYFTGSSVAAKKSTHINADMLSMFVQNKKILAFMKVVKEFICLIVCVVATYWSYNYVLWSINMNAVSNVFKLPIVIGQLPIFISFFLWSLYLLRDLIASIKALERSYSNVKEGE